MKNLLTEVRNCKVCSEFLTDGVNPVMAADAASRIVIIGQAPGRIVHKSGIPWQDKSGDNLRNWMGIDNDTFYDPEKIALLPMGFCYPGKAKSGDLPPRQECAPLWHNRILSKLNGKKLTLLIGAYAQAYYLGDKTKRTLTEIVKDYEAFLPDFFVLPHPSPRNNIWRARNSWFDKEVIPELRKRVSVALNN